MAFKATWMIATLSMEKGYQQIVHCYHNSKIRVTKTLQNKTLWSRAMTWVKDIVKKYVSRMLIFILALYLIVNLNWFFQCTRGVSSFKNFWFKFISRNTSQWLLVNHFVELFKSLFYIALPDGPSTAVNSPLLKLPLMFLRIVFLSMGEINKVFHLR